VKAVVRVLWPAAAWCLLALSGAACAVDAPISPTPDAAEPLPDLGMPAPQPAAPAGEIWFTPNVASVDLLDLFSTPDAWTLARGKVAVLGLYAQQTIATMPSECPNCGANILPNLLARNAFSTLKTWNVKLSIEAGAVKEWDCTGDVTSTVVNRAIDNVEAGGGEVAYIRMDEPFIGGQLTAGGMSCKQTMAQSAAQTANFIAKVHAAHPSVIIGDIEPYPVFTVDQLKAWVMELEKNSVTLPFFHLDVDRNHVANIKADVSGDLRKLRDFFRARKIPFGVIYTSHEIGAPTDPAKLDGFFFGKVIEWVTIVAAAIGAPDHSIFQSWFNTAASGNTVPANLPENDQARFSHARLINEAWALLADNRAERTALSVPGTMTAGQTQSVSVTFRNSSAIPWTARAGYRLGVTDDRWLTVRAQLGASETIAPGQTRPFDLTVVAPATPGSYTLELRMVQEGVEWFGDTATTTVVVH
jgi:hypothetical protein